MLQLHVIIYTDIYALIFSLTVVHDQKMWGPFFLSPPTSTLHPQQAGPAFHPGVSHLATTLGRQGAHSALG